jgi:hypothetical protein
MRTKIFTFLISMLFVSAFASAETTELVRLKTTKAKITLVFDTAGGDVYANGTKLKDLIIGGICVITPNSNGEVVFTTNDNGYFKAFFCNNEGLISLDVTGNPRLEFLKCKGNALTELDLSNNPNLKELDCSYNYLSTLDVSNKPNLKSLSCNNNSLSVLNVTNTGIKGGFLSAFNCSNQTATITVPYDHEGHTGVADIAFITDASNPPSRTVSIPCVVDGKAESFSIAVTNGLFGIATRHLNGTVRVVRASEPDVVEPELVHYSLELIETEGISVEPDFGLFTIIEGSGFEFTAEALEGYDVTTLRVFVDNLELLAVDGIYALGNINKDHKVTFLIDEEENSTSNENVNADVTTISTETGRILINAPAATEVQIVNIQGSVVYGAIISGNTEVALPSGMYIVKAGEKIQKVVVR